MKHKQMAEKIPNEKDMLEKVEEGKFDDETIESLTMKFHLFTEDKNSRLQAIVIIIAVAAFLGSTIVMSFPDYGLFTTFIFGIFILYYISLLAKDSRRYEKAANIIVEEVRKKSIRLHKLREK